MSFIELDTGMNLVFVLYFYFGSLICLKYHPDASNHGSTVLH